ncbi:MAG: methyl-accepting chemotaxis protein [Pseudomonadota bacterium]
MSKANPITKIKGLAGRMSSSVKGVTAKDQTTMIMQNLRKLADRPAGKVPLVGRLPVEKQYLYVSGTLLASLLLAAGFTVYGAIKSGYQGHYLDRAGYIGMLSQRLPSLAQQAVQGNEKAFADLAEETRDFTSTLRELQNGSDAAPASPGDAQAVLTQIDAIWKKLEPQAQMISKNRTVLINLNKNIAKISEMSNDMQELTEQMAASLLESNASNRILSNANQLVTLTQRIAKNANALQAADTPNPSIFLQLEKDITSFRDIVGTLEEAAIGEYAGELLAEVGDQTGDLVESVGIVLANTPELLRSKSAARDLFNNSDQLLKAATELSGKYGTAGSISYALAAVFAVLAVASLVMLGLVNINETKARAKKTEEENTRNQEAILRLMDELGELADGNLAVTASVTEDITGAIADSINFTVEELRTLVRNINNATVQLNNAVRDANQISEQLTAASKRQADEIEETSQAVVNISQSVQQVSQNAAESAQVAEQSLAAAEKGQQAVQNTIAGMNALREQIQETSKRIKRLGESSQEIGEIVELISDITEQTNVLALNAAIQAASAGEAGRGFSVVAEEVQRLAERSAEATKQIAAIVKTIQSDTQDTVAAMEISTQGVVEGAKLSDAAGQTLNEIGEVSKKLATLIAGISAATQSQAEATARVAETMQDIRNISMQTSEGTRQTAQSIGSLTKLAESLKDSVSGFKLA